MGNMHVGNDEVLDVSSLFTNVPVGEAVSAIQKRLQGDKKLTSTSTLSPDRITEQLEMCLRSTHFNYGRNFNDYKVQYWGLQFPPWWPTSTSFEDVALETAPSTPRLWKGDIFCILRKDTAEKLLSHLKRIRPTIKFTMELEEVGPFLSWTLWWEGGRMEVWTSRTLTHIWVP